MRGPSGRLQTKLSPRSDGCLRERARARESERARARARESERARACTRHSSKVYILAYTHRCSTLRLRPIGRVWPSTARSTSCRCRTRHVSIGSTRCRSTSSRCGRMAPSSRVTKGRSSARANACVATARTAFVTMMSWTSCLGCAIPTASSCLFAVRSSPSYTKTRSATDSWAAYRPIHVSKNAPSTHTGRTFGPLLRTSAALHTLTCPPAAKRFGSHVGATRRRSSCAEMRVFSFAQNA